jgi:hypothetical protein
MIIILHLLKIRLEVIIRTLQIHLHLPQIPLLLLYRPQILQMRTLQRLQLIQQQRILLLHLRIIRLNLLRL